MVVFFDIDGTVVDNETQLIPESTIRAIEKLNENGHIPVVNTGRPFAHIDPRVRALAFRGWVCGCGMQVILNGQEVFGRRPDSWLCRYAREAVREMGMRALYELETGAVALDGEYSDHPALKKEAGAMAAKGFTVTTVQEAPDFLKFITYDAPGCRRKEFLKKMEPYFDVVDRGDTMLEFMAKGCSKAAGMQRLLRTLGVATQDTLAIGDSTNDLPMFSVAAHTVCMGGGMEELKREAEYITDTVLSGGIEKALQHYGLI